MVAIDHSSADNESIAARAAGWVVVSFSRGAARVGVGVAAAGASAVELHAIAAAGDAVAFTCTAGGSGAGVAERRGGAGRAAVGAAGERGSGADGRWDLVVGVGVVLIVEGCGAEAGGQFLDGGGGKVGGQDELGGMWGHWLGRLDLRDRDGAAFRDV